MTIRDWQRLGDEVLLRYKVFGVRKSRRRSPRTGADIGFFLIDTADWVTIVALTDDRQIVMVRQYRHGSEKVSLEIPGGLIDAHETDPTAAATRELREETGYVAREIVPIGVMNPNPSLMTNRCHVFLATGCQRVGDLAMDPGEDIEVLTVPIGGLDELLRHGEIDHAIVVASLGLWRAQRSGQGA